MMIRWKFSRMIHDTLVQLALVGPKILGVQFDLLLYYLCLVIFLHFLTFFSLLGGEILSVGFLVMWQLYKRLIKRQVKF